MLIVASNQVNQDVEDGPDKDDEEPEHVAQYDARVFISGIDACGGPDPEVEQDEHGGEYVDRVESDDRIEHGAVQTRGHTQPEANKPDPLEALDREEDHAQHAGNHQPPGQLAGRIPLHGLVRPVHGVTADEEKQGVYARDPDGQPGLVRRRPFRYETRPKPEQDEEQCDEDDQFAGDEEVHAQDFHGHAGLRIRFDRFRRGFTGLSGQESFHSGWGERVGIGRPV